MDLVQIGELARLSGVSVKTIRFYSDQGLVPEADRTPSGYRKYDAQSVLRLELVRTLRELGLDLATIRRVLDRGTDLRTAAAAHAEALDAQIRVLRLQRAVLRALSRREPTSNEVQRMNRIAQATAEERRRIVAEFLDSIFAGTSVDPAFEAKLRSVTPEMPDDPTDEQVDAWIELADLVRDAGFRSRLRQMNQRSFDPTPPATPTGPEARRTAELVNERVAAALDAGIQPDAAATAVVDELVGAFAAGVGRRDEPAYRRELLEAVELASDPRAERYWQLMAIINGWPPIPGTMHLWGWFTDALRASLDRGPVSRPDER
jgi:DNA-binding transcriptional MerR regulator